MNPLPTISIMTTQTDLSTLRTWVKSSGTVRDVIFNIFDTLKGAEQTIHSLDDNAPGVGAVIDFLDASLEMLNDKLDQLNSEEANVFRLLSDSLRKR